MTTEKKHGLVKTQGLTQAELSEIEQLAVLCNTYDKLDLKLNWNTLHSRPTDEANDFLYYADGKLVGYLPLFAFNSQEAEISGMVHPNYRRKGIFTALFNAVKEEIKRRSVPTLLLIVEHSSVSGQAFARNVCTNYHHSEYKMVWEEIELPVTTSPQLHFRVAGPEDAQAMARITALAFDLPEQEVDWYSTNIVNDPVRRYYVGLLDGVVIGKLDVALNEHEAIIYGFGVLPEYRGSGYGRQILAHTIQEIVQMGQTHISLEVATENKHALTLYQSCGFKEMGSYDYYGLSFQQ